QVDRFPGHTPPQPGGGEQQDHHSLGPLVALAGDAVGMPDDLTDAIAAIALDSLEDFGGDAVGIVDVALLLADPPEQPSRPAPATSVVALLEQPHGLAQPALGFFEVAATE